MASVRYVYPSGDANEPRMECLRYHRTLVEGSLCGFHSCISPAQIELTPQVPSLELLICLRAKSGAITYEHLPCLLHLRFNCELGCLHVISLGILWCLESVTVQTVLVWVLTSHVLASWLLPGSSEFDALHRTIYNQNRWTFSFLGLVVTLMALTKVCIGLQFAVLDRHEHHHAASYPIFSVEVIVV